MMKLFHPVSQGVMLRPAPKTHPRKQADNEIRNMKHISETAAEFMQYMQMDTDQRRLHCLASIQERRYLIRQQPDNQWGVYELCKAVYDLAEVDRVDFNGAGLGAMMKLIMQIVPFASDEAMSEGVADYHDSRKRQGWTMCFLDQTAIVQGEPIRWN